MRRMAARLQRPRRSSSIFAINSDSILAATLVLLFLVPLCSIMFHLLRQAMTRVKHILEPFGTFFIWRLPRWNE